MTEDRYRDLTAPTGYRAPSFTSVYQILQHYAQTTPGNIAILAPGREPLRYGELRDQVDKAVGTLRTLGVGRRDRVALVLPNGPEMAVALIAVAAGAVCVPINPELAADEWYRYLDDLRIKALLTQPDVDLECRVAARTRGIPIIDLVPLSNARAGVFMVTGSPLLEARNDIFSSSEDDAFVLPTSGTTSRPKIVPLTHANVCRSVQNVGVSLCLGAGDRLLNVLPLFHVHGLISGLFSSLGAGSSVACTPGFDASFFFAWLNEFRPTWYTAVPTIHQAVLAQASSCEGAIPRPSLRFVRSASATLPTKVVNQLEELFGVPVIDTYGMTEAASQMASNPLPPKQRKIGSVGVAAGPEIAILNEGGECLAAGSVGEIFVRGPNVTRGYDNDPAANEAAFTNDWFNTGDLGYLDDDGYLFIVGRTKEIINRGGQKVAPREVEDVLIDHPEVAQVVVFAVPHDRLGEDVAAAVVARPNAKITARELRNFAAAHLAPFKVPRHVQIVEEIPRGPTGKPQLASLAHRFGPSDASRSSTDQQASYVAPRTEVEWQLAEIWTELLKVERVGITDDFFLLGGDSLVAAQIISRVHRQFGTDISMSAFLDTPTIAEMAPLVAAPMRARADSPNALRDALAAARPVRQSYQQQRLYFLNKFDPTGRAYVVLEVARMQGKLDIRDLQRSIVAIIGRHEILRTTFIEHQGEFTQVVSPATPKPLELSVVKLRSAKERIEAIDSAALEALHKPFDLSSGPLFRAKLLRLDDEDHALLVTVHNLITDRWSQRLFWKEFQEHYSAYAHGRTPAFQTTQTQYREYTQWQERWLESPTAREQLTYWKAHLTGVTALPLGLSRPRSSHWSGRGARHPLKLSRTLTNELKTLGRTHGVTLFMTLLAAFKCLLYRYTEHEDVAVGSLMANRNRMEFEHLMGMLVNTVLLRTDLSGDPTFGELLRRVRQVTLDAHRHQDLPVEKVLQALQVERIPDRNSLFSVMFVFQNSTPEAPQLPGLSVAFLDLDPGVARFDLMLELGDTERGLSGWFEYSSDLFDASTIDRMAGHFQTLLEGIVANPKRPISKLDLLPTKERNRLLVEWNDTDIDYPFEKGVPELLARHAQRNPDAIAVSQQEFHLCYRDLHDRVCVIAEAIIREGVGTDTIVVLLAKRGIDFLAGMIATLQAGGTFLPLDPHVPAARQLQIIERCRTAIVLADRNFLLDVDQLLLRISAENRPKVLSLEDIINGSLSGAKCASHSTPSDLAYVIYTSGSTGVPKGAMIERRGLLNSLYSKISDLGLTSSDVIAQTAPQSFDISVWQFLTAILVGGRVHICQDEIVRDPALLVEETRRHGVTILQLVPSLLRAFVEGGRSSDPSEGLDHLRWMISTGEALPSELCRQWLHRFPRVPLLNAYGPAECSDDVAIHAVHEPASLTTVNVPIGRPIANTRLYVLDTNQQPVPIGVAGELYVGGAGVGRGYLNDPEQTRQNFLPDPFSDDPGAHLYKTGDLVLRLADGNLEFLGRVDNQVKIRGFRIELEEIEHTLVGRLDVSEAAVLVRDDMGGEDRLAAYVVAADGHEPQASELLNALKRKLPHYMVPSAFVFLESMPLTPHGKIDRQALLAIREGIKTAGAAYVPPRDATEELLASIWADLLKAETVGAFDNFFDLGGHSLLAGQVLARISDAFHISLPLRVLFESPTIAELARRVAEACKAPADEPDIKIERIDGAESAPVSITQENVLGVEAALPELPVFSLPFAFRLEGPLDIRALERSLTEAVRRHESLRTGFASVDGRPVPVVTPVGEVNLDLKVEDLGSAEAEKGKRAAKLSAKNVKLLAKKAQLLVERAELEAELEALRPFEVTQAPLFRVRVLRLGSEDHVLLLTFHHIIIDGWSIGIFMEELSEFYAAFVAGRRPGLSGPAIQFSDFARWQRQWCDGKSAARQVDYWEQQLRDAAPIFPDGGDGNEPRPIRQSTRAPVHLSSDLVGRLTSLSRQQNCTLFMTLLTGFKTLLLARTGQNDLCIATAMANRSQRMTERVVGLLENTALVRTRIDEDMPFLSALQSVRESVLEAHARQELPFSVLAAKLEQAAHADRASLHQVVFTMQNPIRRQLQLHDLAVHRFGDVYREGQPVMPIGATRLMLMLKETGTDITGSCTYKEYAFDSDDIEKLVSDYSVILMRAAAQPETSLGRLAEL